MDNAGEIASNAPWKMNFLGLLRQLGARHPHLPQIGHASRPREEPFRIGQRASLIFAPREIAAIDRTETAMPALGAQRASQTERITQQIPSLESNKATGGDGWQAMIQASDELGVASSTAESLERNDIILHPRFGRCVVARPPMFGKLKVRRPTGALLDLHLKVLQLERMPDENGQRVFSIKIKGR